VLLILGSIDSAAVTTSTAVDTWSLDSRQLHSIGNYVCCSLIVPLLRHNPVTYFQRCWVKSFWERLKSEPTVWNDLTSKSVRKWFQNQNLLFPVRHVFFIFNGNSFQKISLSMFICNVAIGFAELNKSSTSRSSRWCQGRAMVHGKCLGTTVWSWRSDFDYRSR